MAKVKILMKSSKKGICGFRVAWTLLIPSEIWAFAVSSRPFVDNWACFSFITAYDQKSNIFRKYCLGAKTRANWTNQPSNTTPEKPWIISWALALELIKPGVTQRTYAMVNRYMMVKKVRVRVFETSVNLQNPYVAVGRAWLNSNSSITSGLEAALID